MRYVSGGLASKQKLPQLFSLYTVVNWDKTREDSLSRNKRLTPRGVRDHCPGSRRPTCGDWMWVDFARKELASAGEATFRRDQKISVILQGHPCR